MTASLAYRKNEAAILRGEVPDKYTRLLPFIDGKRVLELGSAEGVLALLLAKAGKQVTAVERSPERHEAALALRDAWRRQGLLPARARLDHIAGSAGEALAMTDPGTFDTLVAVRMIYYLRESIDPIFAAIADRIPTVVLCGNGNRAARYHAGIPDEGLGEFNLYATVEGMRALLERHGYRITHEVAKGDPIVVGRKDG